jgi:hypothetical protein
MAIFNKDEELCINREALPLPLGEWYTKMKNIVIRWGIGLIA